MCLHLQKVSRLRVLRFTPCWIVLLKMIALYSQNKTSPTPHILNIPDIMLWVFQISYCMYTCYEIKPQLRLDWLRQHYNYNLAHKNSIHYLLTDQLVANLFYHTANEYSWGKYILMLFLLMFGSPFNPAPGCLPAVPVCSMLF